MPPKIREPKGLSVSSFFSGPFDHWDESPKAFFFFFSQKRGDLMGWKTAHNFTTRLYRRPLSKWVWCFAWRPPKNTWTSALKMFLVGLWIKRPFSKENLRVMKLLNFILFVVTKIQLCKEGKKECCSTTVPFLQKCCSFRH